MLETILEALSLTAAPLGLLFLLAAFVAALIDGRWLPTTAYLEDGPPRSLHWVTRAGEVRSHPLTSGDPLAPVGSDQREVHYREEDPERIRLHRWSDAVRALRLTGLILFGAGVVLGILSTLLSLVAS
ncbi:hypothetical protein C1I63_05300 [Rathayibacter caricis DSM 15933]|uniref:DUF3592 domain-containing protein n=1 Tax=Rathayibacter caricis DSM 15933 TaxID=1328867 RepID=A0A2T4US07_9MICO|nr:hypothetical protein [Rathayibacter caricis]PTL72320.1 hypothetical protein C1I63_05300 [Rathayibacter caricis DSM 15933]